MLFEEYPDLVNWKQHEGYVVGAVWSEAGCCPTSLQLRVVFT